MLFFAVCFVTLPLFLPQVTASSDKFTGLSFQKSPYVHSLVPLRNVNMSQLAEHFSFCVWINTLEIVFQPVIFAYAIHDKSAEVIIFDNGQYELFGEYGQVSNDISRNHDQWYHFCGTWSFSSRIFRAYINGTSAGVMITSPGRKLPTGGDMLWGYFPGILKHQFVGEMYNFNMFAKELSGLEIAELSVDGICTPIPEKLQPYRVIKWEEVLNAVPRWGNVTNFQGTCWGPTLSETQEKLLEVQGQLDSTLRELEEMKRKLLEKEAEATNTECALHRGSLSKWDIFYSYDGDSETILTALRQGGQTVRFIKSEGVGAGYVLSAHNNQRNVNSWWALAHRQRPDDQDEFWNVIPWTQDGKKCFKLQKARNRRAGYMLTAHSDRVNSHVRALVHTANHNVPDECWDLQPEGTANRFAIVKSMRRNVGMKLVCGVKRNSASFWVNVDNQDSDYLWTIEITN